MISIDKQYKTRDGKEVRIYAVDGIGPYCVHGAVNTLLGWKPCSWDEEGDRGSIREDPLDLVEVKPRMQYTFDVEICKFGSRVTIYEVGVRHTSEVLARTKITVDVEEGEGL